MANEVVSDVIINYKSVGLDKVGDEIQQTSVALDGLVVASTGAEKATASLENRFKSLERQLGTTEGNAQKFAAVQDKVSKAVAQNPALMERGNAILKEAEQRYLGAGHAAEGFSGQSQALLHSIRSVGEQLALGVSPVQAMTGQLSHLSYVATSPDGVAGAFKQVGSMAGGMVTSLAAMVTPTMATAGALGTIGTVAIAAGAQWASAQKDVENALKGIGRQSGVTVSDINKIAQASSDTTNMSIAQSREIATVFAATGKLSRDNVEAATKATDGLAKSLGVDAAEAAKTLANALVDPARGIDEMEKLTGAYDLKTQELIRSLIRQGEVEQARTILIQGAAAATKDAAEQSGFWANRLKDIKNGFDLLGGDLVKGAELVRHDVGGAVPTTGISKQDQLAIAQADLARQRAMPPSSFNFDMQTTQAYYDQLGKLTDQVNKLKAAVASDELAAFDARLKESAGAADTAVQKFAPYDMQIRQTKDSIKAMTKAQQDLKISGAMVDAASLQPAIDGAKVFDKTLEDAKNTTIEHNQYLLEIGKNYEGISTKVALQLDAMKDQLRVAKATSDSSKESALRAKDEADARRGGATAAEAAEIAIAKAALRSAQGAATALEWQQNMLGVGDAAVRAADASQQAANAMEQAARAAQDASGALGGVVAGNRFTPTNLNRFGDMSGMGSTAGTIIQTMMGTVTIPAGMAIPTSGPYAPMGETVPGTTMIAGVAPKIDALIDSTDKLKASTDSLNATNQELLSPYYTQDPRTSHIGFRSQGMAAGGYVDVPGVPSANDNMIAQIPVASGERIYVDPMSVKRGNAGTTINITAPMSFSGPVNRDEVGRTVYQTMQMTARSIQAATR